MHRRMSVQCGKFVVLQQIVCELIERFKGGRMRKEPDAHPRPLMVHKRRESVTRSCRTDG